MLSQAADDARYGFPGEADKLARLTLSLGGSQQLAEAMGISMTALGLWLKNWHLIRPAGSDPGATDGGQ